MKLIYYFGTVGSSKTATLLSIAHNYEQCHWNVITIKPSLDSRSELIETRAGIPPRKPDIVIKDNESLSQYSDLLNRANVVLVDECQFLTSRQVEELRELSINRDIDVLCFGLRTDSNSYLFEASKRLFELADELIEVRTICSVCGKHASFNKKVSGNKDKLIDPSWNAFTQTCYKHFIES